MCNISSIRAKVKFEQRKSERYTDTRKEKRTNERNIKKKEIRMKREKAQ